MKIAPLPYNEQERLAELRKYSILDTEPEAVFKSMVQLATYICQTPIAAISLVDEHRQWFKAIAGLDAKETSRDVAFCAHAILQDEILVVPDALLDERFFDNPLVTDGPQIRFYAGVPLVSSSGFHLGTLCVIDTKARELAKEQLDAIKTLADSIMAHLDLRLSHKEIRKYVDELQLSGTIFESASEAMIVTDPNNKIITVNPAFTATTGYELSEIVGKDPSILNSGKQSKEFYNKMWSDLNYHGHWDGELWNKRKNGDEYAEWLSINVIFNDDGSKRLHLAIFSDVTEKENAKIKLQQLLAEQKAILETKSMGFVHIKNRSFKWVNESFENMLGYEAGELQGKSVRNIYANQEDYDKYGAQISKNLAETGTYVGELQCVKKNGSSIWLLVSATALKNSSDESIVVTADITNQKVLETTLEKQKDEFETIFQTSKDGIAILDLQTNFLDFNDTYLEMTGFTREELLTKSCVGLSVPEDISHAVEALNIVMKQGFLRNFKKTCIVKDGKHITINMSISLMPDKKRILISTKDITEEMIRENLILEQKKEFETIFKASKDGIAILDIESNFLDFNDAYLDMTGFTREELLQKSCIGLSVPEDKARAKAAFEEAVKTGFIINFEKSCELNGKRLTINMSLTLLPDKKRLLMVSKDITERMLLEENLRSINKHLYEMVKEEADKRVENEKLLIQQSKMAAMGEMIGAIAHQWRQPLNSLNLMAQDIELTYSFNELNDDYVANYKNETLRILQTMSDTIDDFRNFFSVDKKQEEFYIEDAINDVLKLLSSQLQVSSIDIIFNDKNKHMYVCNINELKQALLNILANAKDALLEKKPKNPFIKIDVNANGDKLEIIIEDSAGGIPTAIIDKIFDSYFTTKSKDKGTGIGLYMSKEIVESSLKGSIKVHNTQNGARFVIALPI